MQMAFEPRLLNQQAYEYLRKQIFDQTLSPEQRIVIDTVAREVGTGSGVVRESLFRLLSEGLLDYQANKGFRVTPLLDRQGIEELYDVRIVLEPPAVVWATPRIDDRKIRDLQETINDMKQCSEQPVYEGYIAFQEADSRFHRMIFQFTGNETMVRTYSSLHVHLHMARFYKVLEHVDVIAG